MDVSNDLPEPREAAGVALLLLSEFHIDPIRQCERKLAINDVLYDDMRPLTVAIRPESQWGEVAEARRLWANWWRAVRPGLVKILDVRRTQEEA